MATFHLLGLGQAGQLCHQSLSHFGCHPCLRQWLITHQARWECDAHPSGLVRSPVGLIAPGMCFIAMCPLSFQSWIAKNCTSICLDPPVGLFALMILIADWLSLHACAGPFWGIPDSDNADLTCNVFFAAATAAVHSACFGLVWCSTPAVCHGMSSGGSSLCGVASTRCIHKTHPQSALAWGQQC